MLIGPLAAMAFFPPLLVKPRVALEAMDKRLHQPSSAIKVHLRNNDVVRVLVLACSGPIHMPSSDENNDVLDYMACVLKFLRPCAYELFFDHLDCLLNTTRNRF